MSNPIKAIKKIDEAVLGLEGGLEKIDLKILSIIKNVRTVSQSFNDIKLPKDVSTKIKQSAGATEQLNVALKEQDKLEKNLIAQIQKKTLASEGTARALAKERFETQLINKQVKEAAILSSTLAGAYKKQAVIMNQLIQKRQDLAIKQELGLKLSRKERNELKTLTKEIQRQDAAFKKVDAQIGRHQRQVGNYAIAIRSAAGAARQLASAMGLVGGAFFVVQVIRDAINVTREYGKENATLRGILQQNREQTVALREDSVRLGATTVKTSAEVTKLQIAYARLGFAQQDIIDLTEPTISGSIALNAELDKTANLVGAVVNTFDNFKAADAPEIIDILSLATARSALNFEKLEKGIPIVGGAANAAGVPFTKLVALMGKLADSGIDVSSSSTAIRNILIESAAQGLNYGQILEKIKNSQDKLTASNDEFGKRAAVSAAVLSNNIDKTNELDEALQNAAGTAERMANEELDTLDGAIQLARSAWEGYILALDESTGSSASLQETITFVAENLGKIIGAIITSVKLWTAYKIAVLLARAQTSLMSRALAFQTKSTAAAAVGVGRLTVAWKSFSTALKANALGLALAAIYGLVQAFNYLNKSIGETVKELHDSNVQFIESAQSTINLNAALGKSADRYDELKKKTKLNKDEQKELDTIIKEIAKNVPKAVTEVDKYGNALAINTGKVREFNRQNGLVATLEAEVKIKQQKDALEELGVEMSKIEKITNGGTAALVKGLGVIEKVDGTLKKVTTTFTGTGRAIINYTDLTKEQQLQYAKYVQEVESGIKTIEKDIEANEDVIAALTGVKNARQLEAEANEKAKEEAEAARIENESQIPVVKQLRAEISEFKNQLEILTKDGYENLTAAQADEVKAIRASIQEREKELQSILGNSKTRERVKRALKGSIGFYEEIIKKLQEEQTNLSTSSEQYQDYAKKIKAAQDAIKLLKGELDTLDTFDENASANKLVDNLILGFDSYARNKDRENHLKNEEAKFEISKEFAERRKELEIQISNSIIDLTNTLFDAKVQKIDDEIQANEDKYAAILDNENLNEEQRAAIEAERDNKKAELEKKKRKEERKAAIFNKLISIGQIAIDTAQTISKINLAAAALDAVTLGVGGQIYRATQIPLAIASGAAQAAVIAATPLPAYKKGREGGKAELAYTGDGYVPEIIEGTDGSLRITPAKPTLTHLKEGDIVHPSTEAFLNKKTDKALYNQLHKHGVYSGMNQHKNALDAMLMSEGIRYSIKDSADAITSAIKKQKTRFNVHINNNIAEDLRLAAKLNNQI